MPMYNVTVTEEIEYTIEVLADDEDDALQTAEEIIVQSANRNDYFSACTSRTARITGN